MVTLKNTNQTVLIDNGELISYRAEGYEFMHQKGNPGWGNTDTEMFPIIGPTEKAGYRVQVPKGNAIQDQHGLLREMEYTLVGEDGRSAAYIKEYKAGTLVANSKFPERSKARQLIWPFNFRFIKEFNLSENGLEIVFKVSGDMDMPFMIGYHPAFQLRSNDARIVTDNASYGLEEIMAAGNTAVEIPNTEELVLQDEKDLRIKTSGFGHFMLWSPVSNMVCIEPISFYPYAVDQVFLHEGFSYLNQSETEFRIELTPKK